MDKETRLLDKAIADDLLKTDFGKQFAEKYMVEFLLCQNHNSFVYIVKKKSSEDLFVLKAIARKNYSVDIDTIKALNHPGIARIVDARETDKYTYIIKEYVEGVNLETYIEENGYMGEKEAVQIGLELCEVLAYLHGLDNPVIFRDLKPANIILARDKSIKLVDVDSLRLYKEDRKKDTIFIGTEGYAAPEQFGFSQTDQRTDIYTLGTTLYFLLAGQPPSLDDFRLRDLRQIRIDLSEGMYRIIKKATMFSPKSRYQSIDQVKKELGALYRKGRGTRNKRWSGFLNRRLGRRIIALVACTCILVAGHYIFSNWRSYAEYRSRYGLNNTAVLFDKLGFYKNLGPSRVARTPIFKAVLGKGHISSKANEADKVEDQTVYKLDHTQIEAVGDRIIKISYPKEAKGCEYSYNYIDWHEYQGLVELFSEGYIHLRSMMPDGSYIYNSIFIDSLDPVVFRRQLIVPHIDTSSDLPVDTRRLTLYYPQGSVIKEYSFDGICWTPYEDPLIIKDEAYIFFRAIMPNGKILTGGLDLEARQARPR